MAELLTNAEWPHEIVGSLRPAKGTSEKQLQEALADVELALGGGQTGDLLLSPLHRPLVSIALAARARRAEAFPSSILLPAAAQRILQRERCDPGGAAIGAANAESAGRRVGFGPYSTARHRRRPIDAGMGARPSAGPIAWTISQSAERAIYRHLPARQIGQPALATESVSARQAAGVAADAVPPHCRRAEGCGLRPAAHGYRPHCWFRRVRATSLSASRSRAARLCSSGTSQSHDQSIVVSGTWNANLQLTLDVPAPDAVSAAGVGSDAKNAQVGLPATFGLQFGSSGLKSIALADSTLKAYGNAATLKRSAGAPFHDAATQSIVIPCDASIDTFGFAEQQSKLLRMRSRGTDCAVGLVRPHHAHDAGQARAGERRWRIVAGTGIRPQRQVERAAGAGRACQAEAAVGSEHHHDHRADLGRPDDAGSAAVGRG